MPSSEPPPPRDPTKRSPPAPANLHDAVTIDHRASASPVSAASAASPAAAASAQSPHHAATHFSPAPASAPAVAPGQILLDRYRVVMPLGKGGMGEVVRADDLELSQPVALKFLPAQFAADPTRLALLRAEVAAARQVSHPNVCRVFDIARADTPAGPVAFLCMEFVDGSDLATLLTRIGRLPKEKAADVARQICFGLAAVHDAGLIHRDLKPANVMLDARGRARIADFGLAASAAPSDLASTAFAGTPRYMAPEVLLGEPPSRTSDVYALGLVLYELFTGRPATPDTLNLDQLRDRARASDTRPPNPSTFIDDIEPAVEQAILACLERDPALRPPSAIAVAARLPGGDPLAAALAAGQTPSPELIAASGSRIGLPPKTALALTAVIAAAAALFVLVTSPYALFSFATPAKSVEVLTDRARELLRTLGLPVVDEHWSGLQIRSAVLEATNTLAPEDQRRILAAQPGAYSFWYRQSPVPLTPVTRNYRFLPFQPYPSIPGEIVLLADSAGRLDMLLALPAQRIAEPAPAPPASPSTPAPIAMPAAVSTLFAAAGLDPANFTLIPPRRRAPVDADRILAWRGPAPSGHLVAPAPPGTPSPIDPAHLVVHAALIADVPVFFDVSPDGALAPGVPAPAVTTASQRIAAAATIGVVLLISGAMIALSIRNLRTNRGDVRGATRVALVLLAIGIAADLLTYQRPPDLARIFFGGVAFGPALWLAGVFWLFYVALEPYARRLWPHALITFSRLTAGRVLDPAVARDVLVGLALGAVGVALPAAALAGLDFARNMPPRPLTFEIAADYLFGPRAATVIALLSIISAFMYAGGGMLCLVLGRLLFKSERAGIAFAIIIVSASAAPALATGRPEVIIANVSIIFGAFVLVRKGLLAGFAAFLAIWLISSIPVGLNWTTPWTASAIIPAGLLAALTLAAAALASRHAHDPTHRTDTALPRPS